MDERRGMVKRNGVDLAYAYLQGFAPTLVFCPGFASDMNGTKALFLRDRCAERGQAMLRFDYSGHGESGGAFSDGTIGAWAADARAVLDAIVPAGQKILVGSSMGGWIALLLARDMAPHLAGFVGIAAAPDFSEDLIRATLTPQQSLTLDREGIVLLPNPYGEPTPITRDFLEDGTQHLVLPSKIGIFAPVRLIHGQRDAEVPWRTSLHLAEQIEGEDVQVTLVKDGEHRLSRDRDLVLIDDVCARLTD